MRLTDLEPEFLVRLEKDSFRRVDTLTPEVDGIMFLCPKCFETNKGVVGTHAVICWRPRVPADITPGPGRWEFQGSTFDDLTLVAGSSSVLLKGGCNAHFFIRSGQIVMS